MHLKDPFPFKKRKHEFEIDKDANLHLEFISVVLIFYHMPLYFIMSKSAIYTALKDFWREIVFMKRNVEIHPVI